MYTGSDSTSGRCMGWAEKDQQRIFISSLKENEKEGKNCDNDNT